MELTHFRHLWGVTEDYAIAFPKFKEKGYAGVEALLFVPDERYLPSVVQRESFAAELERSGLEFFGLIWTLGDGVDAHLCSFEAQYRSNIEHGATLVNSMGGHDSWCDDEILRYYNGALEIEAEYGVPVTHEIHRGRPFFHPLCFVRLIDQLPELKLCADFSHWTCASESMLEDHIETIRRCAKQTVHLHTRVGHEEGPQVSDPRAPEFSRYLEAYELWWEIIWEAQLAAGMTRITATPEYGPPPYMPTLPYSGEPVAELETICDWQKERQANHFRDWFKQQ
ncbi:MAG: TIM barrel protein [Verrucomicrobiota bacterium]